MPQTNHTRISALLDLYCQRQPRHRTILLLYHTGWEISPPRVSIFSEPKQVTGLSLVYIKLEHNYHRMFLLQQRVTHLQEQSTRQLSLYLNEDTVLSNRWDHVDGGVERWKD